jgi:anti-sigma B factor antagonist
MWLQRLDCQLEVITRGKVTEAFFRDGRVILNEETAQAVAGRLFDLVGKMAGRTLVLNFANVAYLTSTMLGKLIALHKRVRAVGGRLVLWDMQPDVFEIFEITRLHTIFNIRGPMVPACGPDLPIPATA